MSAPIKIKAKVKAYVPDVEPKPAKVYGQRVGDVVYYRYPWYYIPRLMAAFLSGMGILILPALICSLCYWFVYPGSASQDWLSSLGGVPPLYLGAYFLLAFFPDVGISERGFHVIACRFWEVVVPWEQVAIGRTLPGLTQVIVGDVPFRYRLLGVGPSIWISWNLPGYGELYEALEARLAEEH